MTVLPEAPSLLVHATGPAVVAVDPAISAADVGGSFTVSITIDNVNSLVGYDIILTYDPTVVSCTTTDTAPPSGPAFPSIFGPDQSLFTPAGPNYRPPGHNFCSNGSGIAETAAVSLAVNGVPTSVSLGSPTPVMVLTFKALAATFATLHISLAQLAVLGSPVAAPVTTFDGTFGVPPSLTFILPNATVAPSQRLSRISDHITQVTLVGYVLMLSSNVRAGFGGVTFDVIDPNGVVTTIPSNIAFGFPGDSLTVTATYTFATSGYAIGTYHIVATILRCTTPDSCVHGQTRIGLFFKLKA
jgi:hypothetical protein